MDVEDGHDWKSVSEEIKAGESGEEEACCESGGDEGLDLVSGHINQKGVIVEHVVNKECGFPSVGSAEVSVHDNIESGVADCVGPSPAVEEGSPVNPNHFGRETGVNGEQFPIPWVVEESDDGAESEVRIMAVGFKIHAMMEDECIDLLVRPSSVCKEVFEIPRFFGVPEHQREWESRMMTPFFEFDGGITSVPLQSFFDKMKNIDGVFQREASESEVVMI